MPITVTITGDCCDVATPPPDTDPPLPAILPRLLHLQFAPEADDEVVVTAQVVDGVGNMIAESRQFMVELLPVNSTPPVDIAQASLGIDAASPGTHQSVSDLFLVLTTDANGVASFKLRDRLGAGATTTEDVSFDLKTTVLTEVVAEGSTPFLGAVQLFRGSLSFGPVV